MRNRGVLTARVGGALLAAAFGAAAVMRRGKPLHPLGAVTSATWWVTEPARLGVPLLDGRGPKRVRVRLSRAASLARTGWDIMGLAVRVPSGTADRRDADLLFATTGVGRWTRYLLLPQPRWGVGNYTTFMPMVWRAGTAVIRAEARSVTAYDLSVSTRARGKLRRSPWRPVGRLVLDRVPNRDELLRFRPVESPPAGLTAPAWARALRLPAYRAARKLTTATSLSDKKAQERVRIRM